MLTNTAFLGLCRARDVLREVHDRPLTIDEVAREAAMSPFHFIRQVRSMMAVPRTLPPQMIPGCLTLMGAAFATLEKFPSPPSGRLGA